MSLTTACMALPVGVAVSLACMGCGSASSGPPTSMSAVTPTQYQMAHPQIIPTKGGHPDALYVPDPIRVHVGQLVTWTNRDTDPHDVTSTAGFFASGPIAAGASYSWRAERPGRYPYFCTIHLGMHGVIIVTK